MGSEAKKMSVTYQEWLATSSVRSFVNCRNDGQIFNGIRLAARTNRRSNIWPSEIRDVLIVGR